MNFLFSFFALNNDFEFFMASGSLFHSLAASLYNVDWSANPCSQALGFISYLVWLVGTPSLLLYFCASMWSWISYVLFYLYLQLTSVGVGTIYSALSYDAYSHC